MTFTREMTVRIRDIFDEQMFSVNNYSNWLGDGRSRITCWQDRLGLKRLDKDYGVPMQDRHVPLMKNGFVVIDCNDLKNQLLAYHLMVPLELAEKIIVLSEIPSEEAA